MDLGLGLSICIGLRSRILLSKQVFAACCISSEQLGAALRLVVPKWAGCGPAFGAPPPPFSRWQMAEQHDSAVRNLAPVFAALGSAGVDNAL